MRWKLSRFHKTRVADFLGEESSRFISPWLSINETKYQIKFPSEFPFCRFFIYFIIQSAFQSIVGGETRFAYKRFMSFL